MSVTAPGDPSYPAEELVAPPPGGLGRSNPDTNSADRLQSIMERAGGWPIWSADRIGGVSTGTYAQVGSYGKSLRDIALWVALRENDREELVKLTNWERERPIHLDPLPEKICQAYSDLLYGDEPDFIASNRDDQQNMEEMMEESGLAVDLRRWVDMSVSEGEVFWRLWTDLHVSEWPLVSAHGRLDVVPLFVGRKIVALGFVDNVLTQEVRAEQQVVMEFWRHIEIHSKGYVRNVLYRGTMGQLGEEVSLSSLPETENLDEDWVHGLPFLLAGRIPNKLGRDFRLGVSEFQGVRDLIMDLNEARTIAAENARLVLKARMVVPANAVDADGNFDAGKDVLVHEALDEELAGQKGGPYAVLEYNFRAEQIIKHKTELTLDILSRVGLAEQFVQESRGGSGQAFTGTALRTRLIPTTLAASGKAKGYDKEVPKIQRAMAMLSALPTEKGGCGKSWVEADGKHLQRRSSVLPEDENEEVQRHVMAVQGEIESVQTAVEEMHGDEWDEDRIALEVERIRADRSSGPTYTDPETTAEDLEKQRLEAAIPNIPPGGPGSSVATPQSMLGSEQPGVQRPIDGQSPGKQPPIVPGGGPK